MLQEAQDFLEECNALAAVIGEADDARLATITQFKGWTIEDVIAHLHMWNVAAMKTLESRETFMELLTFVMTRMGAGDNHPKMQRAWLAEYYDGIKGADLYTAWRDYYPKLAAAYGNADPEKRVAWGGPDMSVSAKIIARHMETWAHGQEVFDILGAERRDTDRIKSIVEFGVRTYGWSFKNRGEEPPLPKSFVDLTAPSGASWQFNEPQADNIVRGSAVEFAQVVTQTRNIADTTLEVIGENATRWMAIAQCFAGGAEEPPAPGTRKRVAG